MRIAFYPQSCVPYHGNSLEERPLGGTETAIIRLSQALHARGHTVVTFTPHPSPPPSQPQFLHLSAAATLQPVDVFVVIREWIPILANVRAKKRFFWTEDAFDQVHSFGIGDKRVAARVDAMMMVSKWQADTICEASGYPREKVCLLRNGVHLPYFEGEEPRKRKRLIYSSTPFRGLELMVPVYSELKKRHPDLELHVFSGLSVYAGGKGHDGSLDPRYQSIFNALKCFPDVVIHGNVKQEDLAREFMRSGLLAYPNTFAETSCITVMEAQAGGCAIVTSELGALPESVGDAGILIPGAPGSPEYMQKFINECDRVLSDDDLFAKLTANGLARAKSLFDWNNIAAEFEAYLRDAHGIH